MLTNCDNCNREINTTDMHIKNYTLHFCSVACKVYHSKFNSYAIPKHKELNFFKEMAHIKNIDIKETSEYAISQL
jgi:hypothetical protein